MKILDRYLVKAFIAPFGACVAIFSVLVALGRFFEKMDIFNNYHAHAREIAVYLVLGMPFWLNMVLPVATMLSVLFALGALQQRGEITAFRSAGISSSRLYAPLFAVGLALTAFSIVGGMTFLPRCNFAARKVYRVQIKKEPALSYRKDHVVVAGRNHRRFTIGWLDVEHNHLSDVIVDRVGENMQWIDTLSAKDVYYKNGQWVFTDGTLRRADPLHPGSFIEESFKERVVDIPERPADFIVEDKLPEDMTGREILRRIDRLRWIGAPSHREQVEFQLKTALPFANIIVIALGIPFAVRPDRHVSRAQTFAYALALAFMYWGVASICQSFGEQGHMPAWTAAWTSNVIFTVIALWRWRLVR